MLVFLLTVFIPYLLVILFSIMCTVRYPGCIRTPQSRVTIGDVYSRISDVLLHTLAPKCSGLYLICSSWWFLYRTSSQHGGLYSAPHFIRPSTDCSCVNIVNPMIYFTSPAGGCMCKRPPRLPRSIPRAAVKCEKAKRRLAGWSDRICKAPLSRQNPIKTSELAAGWGGGGEALLLPGVWSRLLSHVAGAFLTPSRKVEGTNVAGRSQVRGKKRLPDGESWSCKCCKYRTLNCPKNYKAKTICLWEVATLTSWSH